MLRGLELKHWRAEECIRRIQGAPCPHLLLVIETDLTLEIYRSGGKHALLFSVSNVSPFSFYTVDIFLKSK